MAPLERELLIDNLLVRIHFIIVMIRWTGLAPWEFEFPFPGSLTSTFLGSIKYRGMAPISWILQGNIAGRRSWWGPLHGPEGVKCLEMAR